MKRLILFVALLASPVLAENGSLALQLPNPPMNYQADKFRAGNLDCSNAIGGGTNIEFGVTGVINNVGGNYDKLNNYFNDESRDVGVYARIVIPLDKPKDRINCNELFELELRQRRLEVMRLQEELNRLKALQESEITFEN